MIPKRKAFLKLENGSIYEGYSFGYVSNTVGEIVFSTNMVGYVESLTDPSFCDQILCLTYPLIGNYGVPKYNEYTNDQPQNMVKEIINPFLESKKIWVNGLLVSEFSDFYTHFQSKCSLSEWLIENKIPALEGIDTRRLTIEIRSKGDIKGSIYFDKCEEDKLLNYEFINLDLVKKVSTLEKKIFEPNNSTISTTNTTKYESHHSLHIGLIDCGVKNNILRNLLNQNVKVTLYPYNYNFNDDIKELDGIFISNGPGDPYRCVETINNIKQFLESDHSQTIPLFGICLGNQLLSLAAGGKTYKMKYGNRGYNQPVINLENNQTYITSQNHGYAVDSESLPPEWKVTHINKNDGSNEGIKHRTKPLWSVQFHPEAKGGPNDTNFMFKEYVDLCYKYRQLRINKDKNINSDKINEKIDVNSFSNKKTILLLGSGGLSIGQAGEFDYSGSQAIKSLKELNLKVVLINPNIASVQTSPELADVVYYLPVEPEFVEKIIINEKPDYISLSFGGQTALNCGIKLNKLGILYKYKVKVVGTSIENIMNTEDRERFASKMATICQKVPISKPSYSVEEAINVAEEIGYPVLCRAAYALGGLGSGFCNNKEELVDLCLKTFSVSSQIFIDEDLRGWKELEYEVVRDKFGNCIVVCNMENFDPLGIHTGDSIVVAPSQTLNDDEYNMLRTASIEIASSLDIVGECNVQFALDPFSKEYRVIEVNPRLSRSSALASKVTGYPIAYIAAKLCLGNRLSDLKNNITGNTTANFEPSLDYIVIKIPKWDMKKFSVKDDTLGSAMKSVGEVMAIGKNFEETLQKGMRMVGKYGFIPYGKRPSEKEVEYKLTNPNDDRLRYLAFAIYIYKKSLEEIYQLTKIDPWFLSKLFNIYEISKYIQQFKNIDLMTENDILLAKKYGFNDEQIGIYLQESNYDVMKKRIRKNVRIKVQNIDTLAGEYPSKTNYLYTTYHNLSESNEQNTQLIHPQINTTTTQEIQQNLSSQNSKKIIVLGSGPYRIGSSVEFDYCSVKCIQRLRENGYYVITINCNPETISTDYDESDKLYFEEITIEKVLDIYKYEKAYGVIVSMGGQEPNNIALQLHESKVNVLGTSPLSIDICEDRSKFSNMLDNLKIEQPSWTVANNEKQISDFIKKVGFPVVIRPSYVLSGAAMRIIHDKNSLNKCLKDAQNISPAHPVVITQFIEDALEVDVDTVFNESYMVDVAISEHLENAGVHSGDATLIMPPQRLSAIVQNRMIGIANLIGSQLKVKGLFNTQFLVKGEWIGVIETNLRSSRSIPFVSKSLNTDFIKYATDIIMDKVDKLPRMRPINYDSISSTQLDNVCVKSPQFSFRRIPQSDPKLGIEMASTGEVACFGDTLEEAYIKSVISSRCNIPISIDLDENIKINTKSGVLNILVINTQNIKSCCVENQNILTELGHNIECINLDKSYINLDTISKKDIIVDCTNSESSYKIRRNAVDFCKYLITNKAHINLLCNCLFKQHKIKCLPYTFYQRSITTQVKYKPPPQNK